MKKLHALRVVSSVDPDRERTICNLLVKRGTSLSQQAFFHTLVGRLPLPPEVDTCGNCGQSAVMARRIKNEASDEEKAQLKRPRFAAMYTRLLEALVTLESNDPYYARGFTEKILKETEEQMKISKKKFRGRYLEKFDD